ncbi:MAG: hypothetical protein MH825_04905 [Cyanobacteria bacterium]|nr:hypothetical protein [Cyanobacteriota bacterium]
MVDLKPVVIALTNPDRAAAIAAVEQADAALGRALYCDRLAMGALAGLLQWLGESATAAALDPTLDGWLGQSSVAIAEVGCLICATFGPEVLTAGLPSRWDLPLDLPDDCLGVVPVGLSAALDRAYLWGYCPLVPGRDRADEDGTIPLAPLHSFERLGRRLDAIREGVALVTADHELGRQLQAHLVPEALTAAIAALELIYQESPGGPAPLASWGAIAGDVLTQTAQIWPPPRRPLTPKPVGPVRVSEAHGTYQVQPVTPPDPAAVPLTDLGMQLAQRLATLWPIPPNGNGSPVQDPIP